MNITSLKFFQCDSMYYILIFHFKNIAKEDEVDGATITYLFELLDHTSKRRREGRFLVLNRSIHRILIQNSHCVCSSYSMLIFL